ncbi:hypothetical protein COCCADRAFT_90627 [Bipolaris zeicola 26-R-13]|uniref:Uncharacterized protein n=1 Tax=Cochliobolus carbonum (strain 26-R-13) TaxID=930089 RepID=W6Y7C0_COCC2|nr:uncharacterized protein COCCADRAFT_90627 [Bipolaris zeicola 26-R-13]EUC35507.1 hypothetical protein COCCADRAFT_90627 [Bipolaris zeicola 26-R-13]
MAWIKELSCGSKSSVKSRWSCEYRRPSGQYAGFSAMRRCGYDSSSILFPFFLRPNTILDPNLDLIEGARSV